MHRAGARLVIDASQDWPVISLEEVVQLQPEYLIFSSDAAPQADQQIKELRDRPGWRELDAVRNAHVIVLSEAINHPSPRLVDAIEQLARTLHPDRFASRHPVTNPGTDHLIAALPPAHSIADSVRSPANFGGQR